jgi:hypothetical protein
VGSGLDGRHRHRDVALTGNHDDGRRIAHAADRLENFEAGRARHVDVEEPAVHGEVLPRLQEGSAIFEGVDAKALETKDHGERVADGGIIIHDGNPERLSTIMRHRQPSNR